MALASLILLSTSLLGVTVPACGGDTTARSSYMVLLTEALACDDFWVAVHATEYMIDLGHTAQAEANCRERLSAYEAVSQKRVGLWRVQYQLASAEDAKARILDKLVAAYLAPEGPDRVHAAETLAKLRFCFNALDQQTLRKDREQGGMMGAFVTWGLSVACDRQRLDDPTRLLDLLNAGAIERRLAAYGLSFLGKPIAQQWQVLATAALEETEEETKAYLLGAAYQLYDTSYTADATMYRQVRAQLLTLSHSHVKSVCMELCRALASRKDKAGKTVLARLATSSNTDIRATAAYALLKQYINE